MRWTGWIGLAAGLLGLSGCYYGYRTANLEGRYSTVSRPDASYFCYDCHGYRFFDPYYDWCEYYGFRYRWAAYPRVMGIYRERYVRIREQHPEYGRYRYKPGHRASARYREERDFDSWRSGQSRSSKEPPVVERKGRKAPPQEKERHHEGPRERKERKGSGERRSERGGGET